MKNYWMMMKKMMENLQKECQLLTNSFFEVFKNRLVHLSFDIETGGEYCGIVQISYQKFQLTEHNNEISAEVEPVNFNKYVKPPSSAIWDTNMCRRVHGMHYEHENIRYADDINTVWNQFYEKFEI